MPQSELPNLPAVPNQIYTDDQSRERRTKLRQKVAAYTIIGTSALCLTLDNAAHYNDDLQTMFVDNGEMIENVPNCPELPPMSISVPFLRLSLPNPALTEMQIQETQEVENTFKDERSAAQNFKPARFNPLKFALEFYDAHQHEQASFVSEYSGINFRILSDKDDAFEGGIDTELLDELFHSSLNSNIDFKHIQVEAFMSCLRDRFITNKELAGKQVSVFVPSEPGMCWSNGLIQKRPFEVETADFCDTTGATYVDLRFAVNPIEYKKTWMVFMASSHDTVIAQQRLALMSLHEPAHLFTQYADLPFRWDPNERLAEYIEVQTIESLYPNGIPEPFKYKLD